MHYLQAEQYTYLAGEINALYHEAAVKMGVSDSVQNILYVLWEKGGRCPQSEIARLAGISRQTIHSAVHKLEREGIVRLEQGRGHSTVVCLIGKGEKYAQEKVEPLFRIENQIWKEWSAEEQQQYLLLTQKYRDALKKYLSAML